MFKIYLDCSKDDFHMVDNYQTRHTKTKVGKHVLTKYTVTIYDDKVHKRTGNITQLYSAVGVLNSCFQGVVHMSTTMKVPFSGKFVVSSKVEKRVQYRIKPAQYPTQEEHK